DDVHIGWSFAAKGAPHGLARFVHTDAAKTGVRSREIDILKDAHPPRLDPIAKRTKGAQPHAINHHHLARLDIADVLGTDEFESGRFARDHITFIELSEAKRPEAKRIADGDELFGREEDEAIGALDL